MSDAEHQLLVDNAEQAEIIARLRVAAVRAAHAAIAAQDRIDGAHEGWLDDLVRELSASVAG